MNGKNLQQVKEIFDIVVKPHIENIKKDVNGIDKKIEKIFSLTNKNEVSIVKNETNIKNIKGNFRNYILLVGVIFAGITVLIKLFWK